jgi:hypothetical protein
MARPHPALIEIAASRPTPHVHDVSELIHSALEHRMAGLVLSRVLNGEFKLSGPWLHMLAQHDLCTRAHQQRLWTALQGVIERLRGAGFDVATVKGVTAQARWYDRAGERPCTDIDLLVNPSDVHHIEEIVRLIQPDHFLVHDVRSLVARGYLQSIDMKVSPGVWVDLHVDLFKVGIPSLQYDVIWDRTHAFPLANGSTVRIVDPELALIHLLLHLNRDRFSYLLGLVDVARILEREDLDWGFIDRFLYKEGLETPVYLALETVFRMLALHSSPPPAIRGWRAAAWNVLWPPNSRAQGHSGAARRRRRRLFLPFLVRGRNAAAWRWLLGRVFPPRVMVAYRYGASHSSYMFRLTWERLRRLPPRWHNPPHPKRERAR